MFGGQNRGFGSTNPTGGSLFGTSGTPNTSFGSSAFGTGNTFGSNTNNTTTGGSLFGGNQSSGFGSTGQSNTLFGGGGTGGGSGFGSTGGTGFGGATSTALGGTVPPAEGTANPPFSPFTEKDTGSSVMNHFQSISLMAPYQKYSFEVRQIVYPHFTYFSTSNFVAGTKSCRLRPWAALRKRKRPTRSLWKLCLF